jgi:hypothetical protein
MSAGFRARTRLCPVLETAYIQNPRTDTAVIRYLPGYRRNACTNTVCSPAEPSYDLVRPVRPVGPVRMMVMPITIDVTFVIQGPVSSFTYTNTYNYGEMITDVWDVIKDKVFELYGNTPIRYGKLDHLTSQASGVIYLYGSGLPESGGIFTPSVTFV